MRLLRFIAIIKGILYKDSSFLTKIVVPNIRKTTSTEKVSQQKEKERQQEELFKSLDKYKQAMLWRKIKAERVQKRLLEKSRRGIRYRLKLIRNYVNHTVNFHLILYFI